MSTTGKHLKQEYSVYEDEELIDVLSLSKKEATEYRRKNPTHILEVIEELDDFDFVDNEG